MKDIGRSRPIKLYFDSKKGETPFLQIWIHNKLRKIWDLYLEMLRFSADFFFIFISVSWMIELIRPETMADFSTERMFLNVKIINSYVFFYWPEFS